MRIDTNTEVFELFKQYLNVVYDLPLSCINEFVEKMLQEEEK